MFSGGTDAKAKRGFDRTILLHEIKSLFQHIRLFVSLFK